MLARYYYWIRLCLSVCVSVIINSSGVFDEHTLLFLAKAGVMRLQLKRYIKLLNVITLIARSHTQPGGD